MLRFVCKGPGSDFTITGAGDATAATATAAVIVIVIVIIVGDFSASVGRGGYFSRENLVIW